MPAPIRRFLRSPLRLLAAAALAALPSTLRADWTLTNADFAPTQHLIINEWSITTGLSATDASGGIVKFANRDIVSLSSGIQIAADVALQQWKITLRNGDTLLGKPTGFSGQTLLFQAVEFDTPIAIPIKAVAFLAAPPKTGPNAAVSPLPAATDNDLVRLGNNDLSTGLVLGIEGQKLQIALTGAPADKTTDIPLQNVAQIAFGGAAPPRAVPPLSIRMHLASGSVYTVPLDAAHAFHASLNTFTFKDSAGHDHKLESTRSIAAIDLLGGRIVYLAELDPASEDQTTFLGTHWPMQINKNVLGGPLRADHADYDHGIGVHVQDTLTYELDGSFDTLTFRFALDDSAAPNGEAKASVILDGKTLWKSDTLKPGVLSANISLPVNGGKRLELHADPTARLDIQGRLDWLNLALKRK